MWCVYDVTDCDMKISKKESTLKKVHRRQIFVQRERELSAYQPEMDSALEPTLSIGIPSNRNVIDTHALKNDSKFREKVFLGNLCCFGLKQSHSTVVQCRSFFIWGLWLRTTTENSSFSLLHFPLSSYGSFNLPEKHSPSLRSAYRLSQLHNETLAMKWLINSL